MYDLNSVNRNKIFNRLKQKGHPDTRGRPNPSVKRDMGVVEQIQDKWRISHELFTHAHWPGGHEKFYW